MKGNYKAVAAMKAMKVQRNDEVLTRRRVVPLLKLGQAMMMMIMRLEIGWMDGWI